MGGSAETLLVIIDTRDFNISAGLCEEVGRARASVLSFRAWCRGGGMADATDLNVLSTQSEISGVNGVKFGEPFNLATPS